MSAAQQFEAMCAPSGAFLIGDPDIVAAKMLDASTVLVGFPHHFQMSSASLEQGDEGVDRASGQGGRPDRSRQAYGRGARQRVTDRRPWRGPAQPSTLRCITPRAAPALAV